MEKKRRHFKCQFELLGKWKANGTNETIPFSEYEKLKRITGLTAEDVSISYQVTFVWFVTGSQKILDNVNANYDTSFSFEPFEGQNAIHQSYVYEAD